ncbi:MAG: Rrf2 family transcriptional regulator [Candidatus Omnitrophica bacterium]|nr:Rrf2 family transcriptional regulator [Candidatus Omnitrophota bacterium]
MSLINRNTDYAIRALVQLAQKKGKVVAVAQLAKAEKMPQPFLRRIMQVLCQNGLVVSHQGKKGGFSLRKKPAEISLGEIARVFQGGVDISQCLFRNFGCHNRQNCFLRKRLKKIEKIVVSELERTNIASFLTER